MAENISKESEVEMYSTKQAGELLGVSRQTISNYVRRGLLEHQFEWYGTRRVVRISREAIEAFKRSRQQQ